MKCDTCFRKDECLLYTSNHEGMKHCLGPFDNQQDRAEKLKEFFIEDDKWRWERLRRMRERFNNYED